ncbi:hypothetical protein DICPUDRAFT_152459 [Dictyostelium purpureum]|uniref:Rab-GAP TBC domain-containing protein n=1 Tax=Dictyostelium purpureum TaxID=5786 RepID=F0ZLE9_DICPU|nr:uncharacterized protein DICPUDRAFT_152459 [Dictyostelium purpureum]EGC35256.1 hypothetical protein DICPUDRAFT_152459 [Dictyostelium purpureum]|eukprot:XP_003288243.1 hypothetical protein DICPUDRAFT_152459 [Dictyostelium purpureum]
METNQDVSIEKESINNKDDEQINKEIETNDNDVIIENDDKNIIKTPEVKSLNDNEIFEKIVNAIKENNSNLLGQLLKKLSKNNEENKIDSNDESENENENRNHKNKPPKHTSRMYEKEINHEEIKKEIDENNKHFNFKPILNRILKGKTLLYTAVELDCYNDIVFLLLKYGADPNYLCTLSSPNNEELGSTSSSTVAASATGIANVEDLETLLSYYKKPADKEGVIHLTVRNGDSSILNLLLDYGADVNILDSLSRSPIIIASANGNTECARLLVLKSCNVNHEDLKKKTALHLAIDGGFDDIATTLTHNGGDVSVRYHYRPRGKTAQINLAIPSPSGKGRPSFNDSAQDYTDYKDVKIFSKLDRYGNIQDSNGSNGNQNMVTNDIELTDKQHQQQEKELELQSGVGRKYSRKSTMNSGLTTNISKQKNKKEIEKELERSIKWTKLTKKWAKRPEKRPLKVRSRSIKGIPDRMRSEVWLLLSMATIEKEKNKGLYDQYVNSHSESEVAIDLDVNRAFRNHIFFRERYGIGQVSLFNVLKAYSIHDRDIGYTQGMSSIASLLVMYLPEEDAFWTLQALMNRPEYNLRPIFLPGLPGFLRMAYVFENLLNDYFPTLKKALDDIYLGPPLYTTKWFLIGYLDSFPFHIALRIWDLIFSEGYFIVYSVAMSLFRLNEKLILENKDSFEKCYNILRSFENFDMDEDLFINYIMKHKINVKKIIHYENKYDQEKPNPSINRTTQSFKKRFSLFVKN